MNAKAPCKALDCRNSCPFGNRCCLSVNVGLDVAISELQRLGPCQLLVKQAGLTSISPIQLKKLQPSTGSLVMPCDRVQLIDTTQLTLFRCPFQKTLRVGLVAPKTSGISFLNFRETPWDSLAVDILCETLQATPKPANNHCVEECSKWLDDWSNYDPPSNLSPREKDIQLIRNSHTINIHIDRGCVISNTTISPRFIDFDGLTVRMSERYQDRIVIADLGRTCLANNKSGQIKISLAG